MERTSREAWAKRIERWKDSGLTAAEYATEVGINARSLLWWSWRLRSSAKALDTESTRRRPRAATAKDVSSSLTFIEVPAVVPANIEIVLTSGIRICLPPGFDATAFGRVLDVLEKRR